MNGLRHEKGRLIQSNGAVYEGQFKENMKHGHGMFKYADGNVYKGEFKNGK